MRWIVILLLAALVASQVTSPFDAGASAVSDCSRWIIAIIPAPVDCPLSTPGPSCQPPEGWEPVSGVVYGKDNASGVLLRHCIEK